MGAFMACLAAKLTGGGGEPLVQIEDNKTTLECCNCDERSSSSGESPRKPKDTPEEPQEREVTDVTNVPSELQSSPRTIPPPSHFDGPGDEETAHTTITLNIH